MPKVLIQAGHLPPREPGIPGAGAPGEVEMVKAIRDAAITLLNADARFEGIPAPGNLPDGKAVDAALFLHCDSVANTDVSGFSLSYPTTATGHRKLADRVRTEYLKLPSHPPMRRDNPTADSSKYYGYKRLVCPSMVLVEHGFVSNPSDRAWMKAHVKEIARAEYVALCAHFGLEPEPGEPVIKAKLIAIQARHKQPIEPGQSGGPDGAEQLESAVQDALAQRLKKDPRFTAATLPGDLPARVDSDLAVVLSVDSAARPEARGFYFAYPEHPKNARLASLLAEEVEKLPGAPPHRADNQPPALRDYFGFQRLATPEGEVMFQLGFVSNAADVAWFTGQRARVADACYRAFCRYFSLTPRP